MGIRGEKDKKKKKKRKPGELNRRCASISLKSPMPYLSPTVTVKLHCEQFWTFIVIVTFDLLRTLLRMRAYEQTNKDNYMENLCFLLVKRLCIKLKGFPL